MKPSLLLAVAVFGLVACQKPALVPRAAPGVAQLASITVTSSAFGDGGRIPVDHTCDGSDAMPPLTLSSPPEGTKSLAIVVEDPDAPSGTFTHLLAYDLPPETSRLSGDFTKDAEGAHIGLNDFQVTRYSGPCPPRGEVHRYRFRVVALDAALKLAEGANRAQFDAAIDGHLLGEGSLTAYFGH